MATAGGMWALLTSCYTITKVYIKKNKQGLGTNSLRAIAFIGSIILELQWTQN